MSASSISPLRSSLAQSRPRALLVARWAALALVLGLAAVLRYAYLSERGLIFWDEAKFALEGIRMQHLLLAAAGHGAISGKTVGSAKPGHALLIGLAYLILGVHAYAPLYMNATLSLASVPLVFLICRRLFDFRVALAAAALFAVSAYDVLYARSALSESDSDFFLLLGVLAWTWVQPARLPRVALSGLLLGLAFTVNYRLIIYVGTVVAIDLAYSLIVADFRRTAGRLAIWATSLPIAAIVWELADLLTRAAGHRLFFNEITSRPSLYFAEIYYQLHEGKQSVLHFDPLAYIAWFESREGVGIFILLLIGFGYCASRRTRAWCIPATLVLLPFAVYTFAPFVVPRNMMAAIPFACILAAAAFSELASRITAPARVPIALSVLAVLLAAEGTYAWQLSAMRSGFAKAALFVKRHGNRALTTNELMVFYLRGPGGTCHAPPLPGRLSRLGADEHAGYTYAVLEPHHNSRVSDYIRAHGSPVRTYFAWGNVRLGESPIASENGAVPVPSAPPETLTVYQLPRVAWNGRMPPQTCNEQVPT